MLEFFGKRLDRDERGFTLIELMVVVLIIAILIAIAIPTFLGLRQRAQDRAAQSDLRNALTAAKAYYTDGETYAGFSAEAANIEPSITFNTGPVGTDAVSVLQQTDTQVTLATVSESTTQFCIADSVTGPGTVRGVGSPNTTFAECQALDDW